MPGELLGRIETRGECPRDQPTPTSLIGIDLGAVEVKIVVFAAEGRPRIQVRGASRGRPLSALLDGIARLQRQIRPGLVRVAVTGSGRYKMDNCDQCLPVNEVLAVALAIRRSIPGARTVIDLGGLSSKWMLLGRDAEDTVLDFSSNGLCAAGAGAFLEQQAGRLGLTVDRLGNLAASARRGATIAGRCSVFAKSDMIHLQQKGTPPEEIAYGLCQALVRTFLATVAQNRCEAPIVLVGGGAANPGLVRAFREQLKLSGDALLAPEDAMFVGAKGAALMARDAPVVEFPQFVDAVEKRAHANCAAPAGALPPLRTGPTHAMPETPVGPRQATDAVDAYLGLDVGSVSTNLVLLTADLQVIEGIYLPTRGRPVEALHQGLSQIREEFGDRLRILGVGATGSGRHLAAKTVGADVTHNEITAQMVSSLLFFPEVDTIFEIGGQDSKYISVHNGQLADFEMNKICAGGTGSFLEEQAERLGIQIIGEFSGLALRSANPCDLGARCTVFMDTELVRAQERGVTLPDLCAGLAYSVARNYLEKVVAGRHVGNVIVFQGGTASNQAVVAAFRQLLGRPVHVHPYNRVSGAIGAALLAAKVKLERSRFLGFESCASAAVRSFECRRCENRCQVNRIQLGARNVHFGDVCDRYSQRDQEPREASRPFPELFAERCRLLEQYAAGTENTAGRPRLGLLRASLNLEFLPFWAAFLRELDYEPVISAPATPSLLCENMVGLPAEVCLPIKVAAAQARALLSSGVENLFMPALLECPQRGEEEAAHTCFYTQQLPDMLRVVFPGRIIPAQFALREGILGLVEPVLSLAEALNRPLDAVRRAFVQARAVQAGFVDARSRLGHAALAAPFDRAAVVLGRPYNTHDPFLNLGLVRHLERLGLPAIPWDLLPLEEVQLDPRWRSIPWHYNRQQLRALELIRKDRRLFPILISSYGCGPDGFTVKHVEEMLAGSPRLLLEFDEHRGEAGLVTRLEAFVDEIEEHLRARGRAGAPVLTPGPRALPAGRRFFIPHFSEHAEIYAATLRSAGYAAEVLPAPDAETIQLGERCASGRECHPYTIIAGELVRLVRKSEPADGDVFLVPSCTSPCLLRQYGDALRILLTRERLPRIEVWDAATAQIGQLVGTTGLWHLYEGLLATDILFTLAARLRPYELQRGAFDERRTAILRRLTAAVADRRNISQVLTAAAQDLWRAPRSGAPGMRPVVGVTGDLYTRMNPVGNAGLFHRLEQLGCEVWPSPFFASMALGAALETRKKVRQGRLRDAVFEELTRVFTTGVSRWLTDGLSPQVAALAVEPPPEEMMRLARPYVGPATHFLIVLTVAKIADFLRRGAAGVISAAGINCVVGAVTASLIPALRADFAQAPVLSLVYGSNEGPGQRIRLETFVHQVQERWRRRVAA